MRVLIAVDGSTGAGEAVTLASSIAWPAQSRLRIVSVVELGAWIPPLPRVPWTAAPALEPEAVAYQRQALDAYAQDLDKATLAAEGVAREAATRLREGRRPADAVVRQGDPAAEILAFADQRQADLIVLGSRGRSTLAQIVLGSVARNVLAGSEASVLIVRQPLQAAP
jgi:nucleotide-binding universal stress UspA family protein